MSAWEFLAWPEGWPWLLTLPVAWWLLGFLERRRDRRLLGSAGARAWSMVSGLDSRYRRGRRWCAWIALAAALIALLQPRFGVRERDVEQRGIDILIALDVSRSMWARDLSPDRLTVAKAAIRRLTEVATGNRMGLVVFAGEARLSVPLTRDLETFAELAELVDPLSVPTGGTDLGAALERALQALEGRTGAHETVLLLTDGEDHEGRGREVARACRERGIVVHTVGFGSVMGSKVTITDERGEEFLRDRGGDEVISAMDPLTLRALADETEGTFVSADRVADPLVSVYRDAIVNMARRAFESERKEEKTNRYRWALAIALAVLDPGGLLGREVGGMRPWIVFAVLLLAGDASVVDAVRAFERGEAATAWERFRAAEERAGAEASAELVYDRALAALAAQDWVDAEAAAERAVARGLKPALRDFLFGNTAYLRAQRARLGTVRPDAPPTAFQPAIEALEQSVEQWQRALSRREDWPEARRNIERAMLELDELRLRQEMASDTQKVPTAPEAEPIEEPEDPAEEEQPEEEEPERDELAELTPAQLAELWERLAEKEREKRRLRTSKRGLRSADVERDW